ncbi:unnamed protein product [Blepharisma stoltei]|uniref:Uncharacterized protein n=1 Tax=Blepharisma stoltei TaxID=1481888 RepID=A0AAU9IRC6_9CILI|nr:unnamed protein product [Blepharisma stoltei]
MSGCPFFTLAPSKGTIKSPFAINKTHRVDDPSCFQFTQDYSKPYISPYIDAFARYKPEKFPCFYNLPFYLQNSLFHHTFISRHRKTEFTNKVMIANELRESGNKNFHKGHYFKAFLCYDHCLGLFSWIEMESQEDDENLKIIQNPEEDQLNEKSRIGMISQVLLNMAAALIKLRNFKEALDVLKEAILISPKNQKNNGMRAICRAANKESDISALQLALDDANKAAGKFAEYRTVIDYINEILREKYQEECQFYKNFFKNVKEYSGTRPNTDYEFEHTVIKKLECKYQNMLIYYRESDILGKVEDEHREVVKVCSKMNWISNLSLNSPSVLMSKHAEAVGLDISDISIDNAFEGVKRLEIVKSFKEGKYNQRLLYQSIQETMEEFERNPKKEEIEEDEGCFTWEKGLIMFLICAILIYIFSTPSKSITRFSNNF